MRTSVYAAAFALAATGCISTDPSETFADAQRLAAERTAGDTAWPRSEEESAALRPRVAALLAAPLDAQSAVQVALLENRGLRALYADLGVAQAELAQAVLPPNPVLAADVRFGLGGLTGTAADVGVVQEVIAILQIPLRRSVAEAERERATLEVASAITGLAAEVRGAAYKAQGAARLVEIRRAAARAAEISADFARRRQESGSGTDLERATAEALLAEAKLSLADAEVEAADRREALGALLGLTGAAGPWSLAGALPPLPERDPELAGLESLAVSRRLDLAAARARADAAAREASLVRLYGLFSDTFLGAQSERERDSGGWLLGPAIEIPIPIFDQRQAAAASARAKAAQRDDELAALAVRIRSDVRRAWLKTAAARRRAAYSEDVLRPLRARILDETQKEYNAMLVGVHELASARVGVLDAERATAEALRDYWVARSELEHAVGGELGLHAASGAPEAARAEEAR